MDRLGYAAISAMRAAMARQAATANNLANASTVGFRADMAAAQAVYVSGAGLGARAMASEEVRAADLAGAATYATGKPLDVAVAGDAMLAVQALDGTEAYTRRGDLAVNDSGLLTTGDGVPVLGQSGPVTLPPYDSVTIDGQGNIAIVPLGGDKTNPVQVDQLKLVSWTGSKVAKGLDGLFRQADGGALPADPDARVASGQLEGSNVNVARALTEMIDAGRSWETQVKMLASAKEMDTDAARLMQLPE